MDDLRLKQSIVSCPIDIPDREALNRARDTLDIENLDGLPLSLQVSKHSDEQQKRVYLHIHLQDSGTPPLGTEEQEVQKIVSRAATETDEETMKEEIDAWLE